jgi:hypothetical protein
MKFVMAVTDSAFIVALGENNTAFFPRINHQFTMGIAPKYVRIPLVTGLTRLQHRSIICGCLTAV